MTGVQYCPVQYDIASLKFVHIQFSWLNKQTDQDPYCLALKSVVMTGNPAAAKLIENQKYVLKFHLFHRIWVNFCMLSKFACFFLVCYFPSK